MTSLKERVVLLAEIFRLARQVAPNMGLNESSLRPLPVETIKHWLECGYSWCDQAHRACTVTQRNGTPGYPILWPGA
ncbi:uncharacterized protein LOC133049191 isoform X2 [Dama dama]|uniref:uncharacterized protein LOC133049191 isoform X2 n=1 Tax=Dama dama TaxID=30532 RepID=UPI002A36D692|nr:uncharacterized protein LOC133049191 isoform X2 [Dama dama]